MRDCVVVEARRVLPLAFAWLSFGVEHAEQFNPVACVVLPLRVHRAGRVYARRVWQPVATCNPFGHDVYLLSDQAADCGAQEQDGVEDQAGDEEGTADGAAPVLLVGGHALTS